MVNTNKQAKHLKIALGTDDFKKVITRYNVFVDKTLFIKAVIDSDAEAILITYPRRWGKTLNLNMLKVFFEPEDQACNQKRLFKQEMDSFNNSSQTHNWKYFLNPKNLVAKVFSTEKKRLEELNKNFTKLQCNNDIFAGGNITLESGDQKTLNKLQIATVESGKYMQYQGKYPTIFISLKDVVGNSLKQIEDKLKLELSKLFSKYDYLYRELNTKQDKSPIDDEALQRFTNIVKKTASTAEIKESISFLGELLYKHYGQRVYVLVDEFDKPVNSLLEEQLGKEHSLEKEDLIKEVTKLISQTVCSPVSKTNPYLEKLILTGIFDTTQKESGSGCNNVNVYGISDINFSRSFGFSNEEVASLVNQFSFTDEAYILAVIKDWYNGYSVPVSVNQTMDAYTPWAVMNYLNTAYTNQDFEPKNYWTQSGASIILQKLLTKETCINTTLSQKLLSIAKNGNVELKFDQQISLFKYDWFADIDNEKFFSYLLLNSGYFTVQKEKGRKYQFSIPNAELLEEFSSIISNNKEKCKTILYNLQKVSHLKIIEMIKENDYEGINKELSESHINCEDKSMNFNFYHLAAIFGNQEVFQTLLESRCSKYLDFSNDKVAFLKPIDYAFMLKNNNAIEAIRKHYKQDLEAFIKISGWSETFFCYAYNSPFGGGTVSGLIDLAKDIALGPLTVPFKAIGYIFSSMFSSFAGDNIAQIFEQNCKQYTEYNAIDITEPKNFNTLKQFEKYLLEREGSYVLVNSNCNESQEKLSELSYPIFENSFYSNEEIKFTLCSGQVSSNIATEL